MNRIRILLFLLIFTPLSLASAEEVKLTGKQISELLSPDRVFYGKTSRQSFKKDGTTSYVDGRPTFGTWRVEGNQYCSSWDKAEKYWDCFDVYADNEKDNVIIWVSDKGVRFVNHYE